MNLLENLQSFPAFDSVPAEQLQWFVDHAEDVTFPAGTQIYKAGEPVDHLMLLLEGRVRIDTAAGSAGDEIVTYESKAIFGLLPYSRMKSIAGRVVTERETQLLRLHRNQLRDLTGACYEMTAAFVHQMTTRVRDFTKMTQQTEKMASLGRLSAGLAHELNNPVAAVVRSVDTIKSHLRATPEAFKTVMNLNLTDEQVNAVQAMFFAKVNEQSKSTKKQMTLLERSSLEDDLTDWLDDHGIDNSIDLAGPMVEFGMKEDDLDELVEKVGEENLVGVTTWIVNNLVTEKLVQDIGEASKRISTLVGSIKNYTHMDRGAGKETVPLGEGIHNTLTLLEHKVKSKHIDLKVSIPDDLPTVCGWPGELNQVWTNLIDNAIDALPEGGKLEISSQSDKQPGGLEFVLTKIVDNGPGIPPDIQDKIFEPFFTTKPIGKGTGLGLDIVQGVVRHHNGSIKVNSKPGHTEFSVCLPVE